VKFTGIILAFYVLLLSATPCCLNDNCSAEQTETTNQHKTEKNDCNNCSPFFNCEGCAASTIVYELPDFRFTSPVVRSVYATYKTIALEETSLEFWQPPKLD
jgi:hypothetical protein